MLIEFNLLKNRGLVTQSQIAEIVKIIARECQAEWVILFGSYALGTATADSDLDLAVVKKSDLPRFKRTAEIRKALRDGGRRWLFPVDIVVYTPEGATIPTRSCMKSCSLAKFCMNPYDPLDWFAKAERDFGWAGSCASAHARIHRFDLLLLPLGI